MSDITTAESVHKFQYRGTTEQWDRIEARAKQVGVSANEWMNRVLDFALDNIPVNGDRATAKKALEDFARSELVK